MDEHVNEFIWYLLKPEADHVTSEMSALKHKSNFSI